MIEKRISQFFIFMIFTTSVIILCYSCTLSFTNVSDHGNAEENQSASPDVKADLTIPTGL